LLFLHLQRLQDLAKFRGASPQQILEACEHALNIQESEDPEFDVSGAQSITNLLSKLVRDLSYAWAYFPSCLSLYFPVFTLISIDYDTESLFKLFSAEHLQGGYPFSKADCGRLARSARHLGWQKEVSVRSLTETVNQ
jgi:hypothetical protein